MLRCEICGRSADKHHIIHRCEGGINHQINIKYLCEEHHRGSKGPHKSIEIDLKYKLELQYKLMKIFNKDFYNMDKICEKLDIKLAVVKRLMKDFKLYKQGYKSQDIIFAFMGKKLYSEDMLEYYCDFVPVYNFV
ncbi:HNH endonuclease [Clostridium sp. 19966]|uniref:HNH endonuclease n=1 Tax=Clostridium sp. 19966 TaxID=2768166 RepID=UPI0028DE1E72|nr:HNH endonuclease signature motif containing protein [Clostridium sp. 19966]MDT8718741.1 HNH endonuclease [Clostridium sp. 19966]